MPVERLTEIHRRYTVPHQNDALAGPENPRDLCKRLVAVAPMKTSAANTASIEASGSGSSCPVPLRTSAVGDRAMSSRRFASAGSTATTCANATTSRRVSLPVPTPTSRAVAVGGRPSNFDDLVRPARSYAFVVRGPAVRLPVGMRQVLAIASIVLTGTRPCPGWDPPRGGPGGTRHRSASLAMGQPGPAKQTLPCAAQCRQVRLRPWRPGPAGTPCGRGNRAAGGLGAAGR